MTELQQTANCYEMLHQLKYYECTDTGHPSLSMLMSMMTMVSDAHSIFMGLDRQKVEQSGGAWVVISYEGHLSAKQPRYGDQVILGTRATASNAFFALREFWMDDLHHHHYAHIKALFVMMNLQKRRLMKIPDELLAPFESPVQKRLDKPKKPGKLSGDFTSQQYRVRYYDIDVNHHVNNARYFDWLTDPWGRCSCATTSRLPLLFSTKMRSRKTPRWKVAWPASKMTVPRHPNMKFGPVASAALALKLPGHP